MKTLREQVGAGINNWCIDTEDTKTLTTSIVAEIKKGPIVELLRDAEWGGRDGCCLSCGGAPGRYAEHGEAKREGHAPGCNLAAILKDLTP